MSTYKLKKGYFMMAPDDPIVVPKLLFTKEALIEQMEELEGIDDIDAADIADDDAVWWVERENYLAFEGLSYGEDFYGREMGKANQELLQRTLDRKNKH